MGERLMDLQSADLNVKREPAQVFLSSQFLKWIPKIETIFQSIEEEETVSFLYPWFLYKFLLDPLQETETQASSVAVNYEHIYHFTALTYFFRKSRDIKDLEHEALLNVAMEFSRLEMVKSIYFQWLFV